MRLRTAAHDWPDGVEHPDHVANLVAADLAREAAMRRFVATHRRDLKPADAATRARLLAGARRGNAAAIAELAARYRCAVVQPGAVDRRA